jgi:hypothetical protein
MQILSHRGYWQDAKEKNTREAFHRSFSLGFGTETDFRDLNGTLVVSHDPPRGGVMTADSFFELYCGYSKDLPLALNIKSDGLQKMLAIALDKYHIENYFVFDMTVPDTVGYLKENLQFFTRQSEYEPTPPLYEQAQGVWLDCFHSDWIDEEVITNHIKKGKQVCLVSPDLHGRPVEAFWNKLGCMSIASEPGVMLCTDFPEEARKVFDGEN